MDIEPTFKGYIEDENDALLILQATLDGKLKHIPRRPYEIERPYLIVSGNIFVFIEEISGIKRWTDGVSWSPSRIANKFLIYKELDKDNPSSIARRKASSRIKLPPLVKTNVGQDLSDNTSTSKSDSNSPSSSLRSVHPLKYTGLVKKTISVTLKRPPYNYYENFHIVSYYTTEDVKQNRLITPKDSLFFRNVRPSLELITAMENTTLGNTKGHNKNASLTPSSTPMGNMEMVNINTAGSNQNHLNPYGHPGVEAGPLNGNNLKSNQNGRNQLVKNEDYSTNSSSTLLHTMNPYIPQSPNPQNNRYYVQQGNIPNGNGQVMNSSYSYQNSTSYMNSDYPPSQPQPQQTQQPPQQQQPQSFQSQTHTQKSQRGQGSQHQGNVPTVNSYPFYISSTPFSNQGYSDSSAPNANSGTVPSSYYAQNEQNGTSATNNLSSITYNAGPYPVYPVNVNMSYYGGNSAFGKAGHSGAAPNENSSAVMTPAMNMPGKGNGPVSNPGMGNGYNSIAVQQGPMHNQQSHNIQQQQHQQQQQQQQQQQHQQTLNIRS